jgi:hypothetical protein
MLVVQGRFKPLRGATKPIHRVTYRFCTLTGRLRIESFQIAAALTTGDTEETGDPMVHGAVNCTARYLGVPCVPCG